MASYEVEHGIATTKDAQSRRGLPDMSSFFSSFNAISTESPNRTNIHATPTPGDVATTFNLAADGYAHIGTNSSDDGSSVDDIVNFMVTSLRDAAEAPPKEVKGVPQEYLDSLDRVSKRSFGREETCPICSEKFADDPYPLVVQLPCHPKHRFDMDCIAPWLKLQGTCPLDRKDLTVKKKIVVPVDDEEEDYDDMIA